jgi:hypothetical protein
MRSPATATLSSTLPFDLRAAQVVALGTIKPNDNAWGKSMTSLEPSPSQNEVDLLGIAQIAWYALVAFLVLGGLLLSARAGDDYMAMSGLLFAGFGCLLGFRLLRRLVP